MTQEHPQSHAEAMVGARAAHAALRIPLQWLNNKVERHARGVPNYRIGHLVRFRLSELEQWRDRNATVIAPEHERLGDSASAVHPPPTPTDFDGLNWHRRERLAEIFVRRYGDDCRYCPTRRRWFVNTADGWRQDQRLAVFNLVRGICREASGRARTEQSRRRFASAATMDAVERLARLRTRRLDDGNEGAAR